MLYVLSWATVPRLSNAYLYFCNLLCNCLFLKYSFKMMLIIVTCKLTIYLCLKRQDLGDLLTFGPDLRSLDQLISC